MLRALDNLELLVLQLFFLNFVQYAVQKIKVLGRRWRSRPYNSEEARDFYGAMNTTFYYYLYNDTEEFCRYVRMSPPQFFNLLDLVGPRLHKTSKRRPLDPELRLAVTLQ